MQALQITIFVKTSKISWIYVAQKKLVDFVLQITFFPAEMGHGPYRVVSSRTTIRISGQTIFLVTITGWKSSLEKLAKWVSSGHLPDQ